jgi:hypothetical protein
VAAVSAGGQPRAKAWECGPALESRQADKVSAPSIELDQEKYSGSEDERFGPTLAAEHLAEEDGIVLDHDTVRLWMLAEGLWSRQRKRKKHRQRRKRKAHFCELVQLDGSFHDWLEGRGPWACLMNMVDDATSETRLVWAKEKSRDELGGSRGVAGLD